MKQIYAGQDASDISRGLTTALKNSIPVVTADKEDVPTSTRPRPKRYARGTDTVPAMLTPGEAVIPRDAVSYYGSDFMRQIINKSLPGYSKGIPNVGKDKGSRDAADAAIRAAQKNAADAYDSSRASAREARERAEDAKVRANNFWAGNTYDPVWDDAGPSWKRQNARWQADADDKHTQGLMDAANRDRSAPKSVSEMRAMMSEQMRSRLESSRNRIRLGGSPIPKANGTYMRGLRNIRGNRYQMDGENVAFSKKFSTPSRFKNQSARKIRADVLSSRSGRINPVTDKKLPQDEMSNILKRMREAEKGAIGSKIPSSSSIPVNKGVINDAMDASTDAGDAQASIELNNAAKALMQASRNIEKLPDSVKNTVNQLGERMIAAVSRGNGKVLAGNAPVVQGVT